MDFTESMLDEILRDNTKTIEGDISWVDDEDHSPAVEFHAEISSTSGHPLIVRGSFNPFAKALTFAIIHARCRRVYALDMGKDHPNPDGISVGEKHKHKWTDRFKDRWAYSPDDITQPATSPTEVWVQFCAEAGIVHKGIMSEPNLRQSLLFL